MKGTDVTAEELQHARQFLSMTAKELRDPVYCSLDKLVRLLAWYGAVRAKGSKPGELVKKIRYGG
jgi:hypothetical protein